ncbi:MAG: MOSC domain-containing protein [Acidobacteria bacterium]|nr:MOSC domain-containing protein [Acidobacteriota bacterium]
MQGRVHQINLKAKKERERGIPKLPVPSVFFSREGAEGDFNRWRHEGDGGNPNKALLLLPLETIRQLNQEGWPVQPGDLGENLTTEGLAYAQFEVGRRYGVGERLQIEISRACDPCRNLCVLPYVGSERGPSFIRTLTGRRGWYARVLESGQVAVGDIIRGLE